MVRKEKTNKYRIFSLVFVFLTISILSLTIGFSAYSTSLAINGKALVRPIKESRITDMKISKVTNNAVISSFDYTAYSIVSDITLDNYNSTVTYNITLTNLSSDNLVITKVNNQVYSNSNIEYTFDDIEINKTKIKPASQYTFKVTFKYKTKNISDKNLKCILVFNYKKVPEYTLKIKSIDGSNIKVVANSDEYNSLNEFEKVFDENTKVKVLIQKDGFYDKEHEFVMSKDINENLELMEKKKYTLKIEPNPSDAIVTIYKNNAVLKTGIGTQEVTVLDEDELKYTVSKYGYNEINNTVKIGKDENIQINLTEIEEKTIDSDE